MINLDIKYNEFINILKDKIFLPLNTLEWKKIYIYQTLENIIILNNESIVPLEQRSSEFTYLVYPEITKGSIAFAEGIITIIYEHYNNIPVLTNMIITNMIKHGISAEDITNVSNTILLKNKKVSGFLSRTKNGFTSDMSYLIFELDRELMTEAFGFSPDLDEYSCISEMYPNFSKINFLASIQSEINNDTTEYTETFNNSIISLINTDEILIDENYVYPIQLSEELIEDIAKLIEGRIVIDSGGTIDLFNSFNDDVCFRIYKECRPMLGDYTEEVKDNLYLNRYKETMWLLTHGQEEFIYNNTNKQHLIKYPIDMTWEGV